MIRVHDLSLPLANGCPAFPGDPPFVRQAAAGAGWLVSDLRLSAHSGTHLDLPAHLLPQAAHLDAFPARFFLLPALVLDLPDVANPLPPLHGRALLLRTRPPGQSGWEGMLDPAWSGLPLPLVQTLVASSGLVLLGLDRLSVDALPSQDCPIHGVLLAAGIPILEGADLAGIPAGTYDLYCPPLRLAGAEAAPTRALLLHPPRFAPQEAP